MSQFQPPLSEVAALCLGREQGWVPRDIQEAAASSGRCNFQWVHCTLLSTDSAASDLSHVPASMSTYQRRPA